MAARAAWASTRTAELASQIARLAGVITMVSSSVAQLLALTLVGLADALVLDAAVRPPVRCSRVAALTAVESWYDAGARPTARRPPRRRPAPPAAAVAVAEAPAEAAEEDDGQPQQTRRPRPAQGGRPRHRLYEVVPTEKAIEEYKKNNPTNAIEEATRKLAGPLSTLAVIGFGFYVIPVVKGIVTGVQEAADEGSNPALSVLGNVVSSVKNPTASVNEIESSVSASVKLPSVSLPSFPNPFGGGGGGGEVAVPAGVEPPIIPSVAEDLASIGKK